MMERKQRKSKPPFPGPGARATRRPSVMRQLQTWFRRYPALGIAYAQVRQRFQDSADICGVGIGRKFREAVGHYGAAPASTGGLCIKIFVKKKKEVVGKDRIPARIDVAVPGTSKKQRVLLDVVSIAGKARQRASAVLQKGRDWPKAGCISPGRLFAFGKRDTAQMNNRDFDKNDVRLGTTGVAIQYKEGGRRYGISAGHVFTDVGAADPRSPTGIRALGVQGQKWKPVDGADFYPPTVRTAGWIRDLMLFPIPDDFCPPASAITWPDGFLRELATQADIERAVLDERPTGFIWVDREGARPEAIPVDLEAACPLLSLPVDCDGTTQWLTYGLAWPLRFVSQQARTQGGDSGSPVFLWTEDNAKCRLLGMHVLQWEGHAYAMDARAFFRDVLRVTLDEGVSFT
jgi:hypothetical protein